MAAGPGEHTRAFPAAMAEFPVMQAFVENAARAAGFDSPQVNKILLASEEALVNVIHYAYGDGEGTLNLTCAPVSRGGLRIIIEDDGVAFNPLDKPDPDITLPIEERPIGGLGIFMVKQVMDDVRYERRGNRNVLTMIKRRPSA